ncbi:MAG: hypothetical protein ACI3YJ_08420 [Prevotella sp.]
MGFLWIVVMNDRPLCATYAITPSGTNIEKYRKNQYLWYFWYRNATWRFGVSGANLCYWLLYMTSSQPMSGPWCVWGISIIFSSVGMSLGSAKYDTYAL